MWEVGHVNTHLVDYIRSGFRIANHSTIFAIIFDIFSKSITYTIFSQQIISDKLLLILI